jgi:mono/diheme cytochrome c family protein
VLARIGAGPLKAPPCQERPWQVGFKGRIRDPSNDMPAFSDAVLSDKDIADIFAFVKSLPGPRSPKDVTILNN